MSALIQYFSVPSNHCSPPAGQVFKSLKEEPRAYTEFLDRYKGKSPNDKMKSAMTDLAFCMARDVWLDLPAEGRGSCFFCIGGINAVNPFSSTAVKNEIVVYAGAVKDRLQPALIPADEGAVYSMDGVLQPQLDLTAYDEIYLDFNGSMAFFGEEWQRRLSDPATARKVWRASMRGPRFVCRFEVLLNHFAAQYSSASRSPRAQLLCNSKLTASSAADPGGVCDGRRVR